MNRDVYYDNIDCNKCTNGLGSVNCSDCSYNPERNRLHNNFRPKRDTVTLGYDLVIEVPNSYLDYDEECEECEDAACNKCNNDSFALAKGRAAVIIKGIEELGNDEVYISVLKHNCSNQV